MYQHNCPVCYNAPKKTKTKYGVRNDCCGHWSWGNYPLKGALTHSARREAHAVFDPLWEDGIFTRTEAYMLLAEYLGLSSKQCHMKLMDLKTARNVPEAVQFIKSFID